MPDAVHIRERKINPARSRKASEKTEGCRPYRWFFANTVRGPWVGFEKFDAPFPMHDFVSGLIGGQQHRVVPAPLLYHGGNIAYTSSNIGRLVQISGVWSASRLE